MTLLTSTNFDRLEYTATPRMCPAPAPSRPRVSFVIPSRRDDRVVGTARRLYAWAAANALSIEIVIVGERGALGAPPGARWIDRRPARKGRCVREGVLASRGEAIIIIDADLPVTEGDLNAVITAVGTHDVVFGNRWSPGSRRVRYGGRCRSVASWTFAAIVGRLFGSTHVDTQCGLKAFKHGAARLIYAGQRMNGLAADVEVVTRARALGFVPENVRVNWRDPGDSTISLWLAAPMMLASVVWLKATLCFGPTRESSRRKV